MRAAGKRVDPSSSLGFGGTCPAGSTNNAARPPRLNDIVEFGPPDERIGETDRALNAHIVSDLGAAQVDVDEQNTSTGIR